MLLAIEIFATAREKNEVEGVWVVSGHVTDNLFNTEPSVEFAGTTELVQENHLLSVNSHTVSSILV